MINHNHGFSETKFDSIGAHNGFFDILEAEAAFYKYNGVVSMNESSWSLFENKQNTLKIRLGLELVLNRDEMKFNNIVS